LTANSRTILGAEGRLATLSFGNPKMVSAHSWYIKDWNYSCPHLGQ